MNRPNLKEMGAGLHARMARVRELGPRGMLEAGRQLAGFWGRMLRHTFRLFVDNRGPYQANALAYRTMVSLVPMLAFMISLLTLMLNKTPDELALELQDMMGRYIVPNSEIVTNSFAIIKQFVTQARQATVLGFIVLMLTSIFLLTAIEQIFNNIWHITRRRPFSWRVLSYTSLIVLMPVMLGLSLYMTASLQIDKVVMAFSSAPVIRQLPLIQWGWSLSRSVGIPLLLMWVMFIALFKWMPNTRVETFSAVIAALCGAALFEICKWGFSTFATQMVMRRQLWWGSLGVFLVFLMWVYLVWWVILFCAQLAYVIQNYRFVLSKGHKLEGRVGEAFIVAHAMLEIAGRHMRGEVAPTVRELAEKLEVEVPRIQHSVGKLLEANLIIIGNAGKDRDTEVYVPGRDLGHITLTEVIRCATDIWRIPSSAHRDRTEDARVCEDKLDTVLRQSLSRVQEALDVTFRELLS